MSNVLKVPDQISIQSLSAKGWSVRRIARELRLNRRTVRRYIDLHPKCTTPPPEVTSGSVEACESESAIADPSEVPSEGTRRDSETTSVEMSMGPCRVAGEGGSPVPGRSSLPSGVPALRPTVSRSQCEVLREAIIPLFQAGLTAQRIHQDLVRDHAFTGAYQSVKRFIASLKVAVPEPVYRVEVKPGEEMQVDFGLGIPITTPGQKPQRTWVFRAVLSFSRKGYSEAVLRQDTESFLRAIENALRHFGGVPLILNLDNLKAAVLKAHWYDPDLNPKIVAFCRHYQLHLLPCRPRTPQHKGKVERGVAYVKSNALKGRVFESLAAENVHLLQWEDTVADTRIHGTTRIQVRALFEQERPHLQPLPISIFECYREVLRRVSCDSFVQVSHAYYQAPIEYVGHDVWVRVDTLSVRIFNKRQELIGSHVPQPAGRFSTLVGVGGFDPHGDGALTAARNWLARAASLGTHAQAWAQATWEARGIEGVRSLMGLCGLARQHSREAINAACAAALSRPTHRLSDVQSLIKQGAQALHQTQLDLEAKAPSADNHPLIRGLHIYTDIIDILTQRHG